MAQAGLKDLVEGEPPRRRPGLMNLMTRPWPEGSA